MSHIQGLRTISIKPNEVLFQNVAIVVETDQAMEPDNTRKGVGIPGVDGNIRFLKRGKVAEWKPLGALKPGSYRFQLNELISKSGNKISAGGEIPFVVVRSRSKVPASVSVESLVRLRIEKHRTRRLSPFEEARGRYVEIIKGENRKTKRPVELAFDQSGRKVDAERILSGIEVARAKTFGKMHEDLYHAAQGARRDSRFRVAVWLYTDRRLHDDVSRPTQGAPRAKPAHVGKLEQAMAERIRRMLPVLEQMKATQVRASRSAPVVFADVTKAALDELSANDDVVGLFLYDPKGIEDLENSMAIANSDDVHSLGIRGSGIKVAVWENGPDSTANLSIAARFKTSPATSDHSRHVHGIIKNTQSGKPRGHARSCSLHSANDKDLEALDWAVPERECTVINQSFHRSNEPKQGTLSFDDIYKDWLALRWPYPTICQAAGNFWSTDPDNITPPSSEYVNHKGYNSLAVGNHNDIASAMSSTSVFRNPTSSHGDRELPEISANGTIVTTVELTKSGTSMASPAAAGVVALIQNTNTTLKHWPEGCRAILLAGATRNVVDDTWWSDVLADNDASDGSGSVNALECHRIALSRRSRNASATRRGWDIGSLRSGDFNSSKLSTFSYMVRVPDGVFAPRRVKVALAWTSKISTFSFLGVTIPLSSTLTVDLDLKIYDSHGVQVGYSGSWDNSYEIAEFTGSPGETYTIRIRRWSGIDSVWYGIGWTVTGGRLVVGDLIRGTTLSDDRLTRIIAPLVR
jgi:Subtilase family